MKVKRSLKKPGSKSFYCFRTNDKILHTIHQQPQASLVIVGVGLVLLVYVASLATGHSVNIRKSDISGPTKVIEIASQSHHTEPTIKATACKEAMQYKLVEEGNTSAGAAFTKYAAYCADDEPISIQGWINTMTTTNDAAASLTAVIQKSKYGAVYFETKGCTAASAKTKHFEFVLVDAPELKSFAESRPDTQAFEQHFTKNDAGAVTFFNLSGSSKLIAPTPSGCTGSKCLPYTHLSAFCRLAPPEQVAQVWRLATLEYKEGLQQQGDDDALLWFSTCGTGIAWLHLRLDPRPKYYSFNPFKSEM
jgi:hypothetical protein